MIIGASVHKLYPFYIDSNGRRYWNYVQGDRYEVTGVDTNGSRFKKTFSEWSYARGINLYRGSRWLVRGGKRWLIDRV